MFIPIEKRALILKMTERKVLLMKPMHQFIYPMWRINLRCPIIKRRAIIMWIHVYPIVKQNFILNMVERDFSFEAKASISFILGSRMFLWCVIMKRRKIVMWIRVCPIRWMDINSKNGRKRSFSYETKAWISFIPMRRICLCYLISKRKKIFM